MMTCFKFLITSLKLCNVSKSEILSHTYSMYYYTYIFNHTKPVENDCKRHKKMIFRLLMNYVNKWILEWFGIVHLYNTSTIAWSWLGVYKTHANSFKQRLRKFWLETSTVSIQVLLTDSHQPIVIKRHSQCWTLNILTSIPIPAAWGICGLQSQSSFTLQTLAPLIE